VGIIYKQLRLNHTEEELASITVGIKSAHSETSRQHVSLAKVEPVLQGEWKKVEEICSETTRSRNRYRRHPLT